MARAPHPPAVVLVGFMGAGKSAVGRELAAHLGLPFVDADAVIVAEAGPIPEIFAARGERGFRVLEAETVLRELAELEHRAAVLSLGGGAVLSQAVHGALRGVALRKDAQVVWLKAPGDELWRRVSADGGDERPLARDEDGFLRLLASREDLYREVATLVVETGGREPAGVAAEIAGVVANAAPGAALPEPEGRATEEGAA